MVKTNVTFEQCKTVWDKYTAYKEQAEQHEFLDLMVTEMRFAPLYADLAKNWDPEHGMIFLNAMQKVLDHFGIR